MSYGSSVGVVPLEIGCIVTPLKEQTLLLALGSPFDSAPQDYRNNYQLTTKLTPLGDYQSGMISLCLTKSSNSFIF